MLSAPPIFDVVRSVLLPHPTSAMAARELMINLGAQFQFRMSETLMCRKLRIQAQVTLARLLSQGHARLCSIF